MRILPLTSLIAALVLPSQLSAAPPFEALAIEQLRCTTPPDPLPLLEQLEAMGKLDPNTMDSMDSISCFPLNGGITIAGFAFHSVCAFEDNPDTRAKRPDLLVRSAGTAPAQMLSFGTDGDPQDLSDWYKAAIGPKHAKSATEPADETIDGKTHVACTGWFAR